MEHSYHAPVVDLSQASERLHFRHGNVWFVRKDAFLRNGLGFWHNLPDLRQAELDLGHFVVFVMKSTHSCRHAVFQNHESVLRS